MLRNILKSRITGLTVTAAEVQGDEGLVVDRELLRRADIWPFERVEVSNLDNGARFTLPVMEAEAGSGLAIVRGPAAHLARSGHRLVITGYVMMAEADIPKYYQRMVTVDSRNRPLLIER